MPTRNKRTELPAVVEDQVEWISLFIFSPDMDMRNWRRRMPRETNVPSSAVAETVDANTFGIGSSEPPSDMINMFPYNMMQEQKQ